MNCRPSTVQPLAFVFLVIAMQTASAGEPTNRNAKVTATILNVATNDMGRDGDRQNAAPNHSRSPNLTVKYIDANGHITTADAKNARRMTIKDLP